MSQPKPIRKLYISFNGLGEPVLRMIKHLPDGTKVFYYLLEDGTWKHYKPNEEETSPFLHAKFTTLIDPADWQFPK